MIKFSIKTFSCGVCGYRQDFEMTQKNADTHFNRSSSFRGGGLAEGACPNCHLKGMASSLSVETDESKKSKMKCFEAKDIEPHRAELMAKPKEKIRVGKEVREETDAEKTERVEGLTISSEAKSRLKGKPQKLTREFDVFEELTDEEHAARVDSEVASIKILTAQEVKALRDKYEDK